MSCLLYCVARVNLCNGCDPPLGWQRQQVSLVTGSGLSAAVSELEQSNLSPQVEDLLAYEKVVEYFFAKTTVVPMRYGCWLRGPAEVAAWLRQHRAEYDGLLRQIEGFGEMSVQILGGQCAVYDTAAPQPAGPYCRGHGDGPGAAYLSTRKQHYRVSDRAAGQQSDLVESLCSALAGTFARRKVEAQGTGLGFPLIAVYFLVPNILVAPFRDAARAFGAANGAKLLLSGPWPPYNFVDFQRAEPTS